MRLIEAMTAVFATPALRLKAIAYAAGLFVLFGIPTALLSNPIIPYVRMIPATPLDYVFLFTTAMLSAVYIVLPEKKACKEDGKAFLGVAAGVLAFSCPTCLHLLVLLVGFEFMFNVVNPLRPIIGLVSILVLAYAIERKFSPPLHQ